MKNFVVVMWAFGSDSKAKFYFVSEEHPVKAIVKAIESADVWDDLFAEYPCTDEGLEQLITYYNDGDIMVAASELPH